MTKNMRRMGMALGAAAAVVALTAGGASAQIQLNLLADVDLSSTANSANAEFIGSNPSAVAWDGNNAWLGGYNNSGVTANTGIVRLNNVLSGTTGFGTAFATLSTPNARGISGLAIQDTTLAASLDTGAGSGDSVRSFNATTGAQNWRIGDAAAGNDSTRRGNGVAFDPGFNGAGTNQGVAYLSIGSGRRHLLNTGTGVYINGQNAGAIINTSVGSTTWRDLAFDPATGDLYGRESNRIVKGVRNGDNTFTGGGTTIIGGLTVAAGVDTQNIAFINTALTGVGNFLIVNDRSSGAGGQTFGNVVKAFDTSGNALSLSFAGGFSPLTGNGAYDFAFSSSNNTLAISDFSNRRLYVFGVAAATAAVPEPGTLALAFAGVGSLGLVAVRRRRAKAA
jgi:hypothetical protein